MSNSPYDMRQKLLELQNELLKNAAEKHFSANAPASMQTKPAPLQKAIGDQESEDMMSLLKEIRSNQHKMMQLMLEIMKHIK